MNRKDILIEALRAAANEMMKHNPSTVQGSIKSSAGDWVTAADLASEQVIIKIIKQSFPSELVITEEREIGHEKLTEKILPHLTAWVIDPLDGTYNFKKGMDYSCISIGYIENGQSVLAGILDPYRDKLYLAELTKGLCAMEYRFRSPPFQILTQGQEWLPLIRMKAARKQTSIHMQNLVMYGWMY